MLELNDITDFTATNYARVDGRENNGNRSEKVETFVKEQKNEHTTQKKFSDMKTFQCYVSSVREGDVEVLDLPTDDLDHILPEFFKGVRKINGDEYKPDTISGFQRTEHSEVPFGWKLSI